MPEHMLTDAAPTYATQGRKSTLIFAKSRIKPVKGMTIPRMELMGALIGTRALLHVKQQLALPIAKQILWSD